MKQFFTLILIALLTIAPMKANWFDHEERERRIETEHALQQERQSAGGWMIVAGLLGVTCVVLLVVGAAIGAKARREVKNGTPQ